MQSYFYIIVGMAIGGMIVSLFDIAEAQNSRCGTVLHVIQIDRVMSCYDRVIDNQQRLSDFRYETTNIMIADLQNRTSTLENTTRSDNGDTR